MTWKQCKSLIWQDLSRSIDIHSKRILIQYLISNSSFKITFWFRIGSFLKTREFKPLYFLVYWYYKHLMYLTGIQLPLGTICGGGLKFYHHSNIVINARSIIGTNVSIYNGVTLGINISPLKKDTSPPVIGNNVVICTGAKVIGDISVGDYSVIGANSVVIKNVPAGSVVVGIPARIISDKGEEYAELYSKHK